MDLLTGAIVRDRYKLQNLIARGGYGFVYLGECLLKRKKYAIKVMLDCNEENIDIEESIKQFRLEAQILARLDHPQLPKLEDYFEDKNKYFLVMEYITGNTLFEIVDKNLSFLSQEKVINWGCEICEILDYLHSFKPYPVIYRDLKPQNIMYTDEGKLMLIDFGISKVLKKNKRTMPAAKSVTPHFGPPEQYSFTETTDFLSDIYSLGATLYYLITKLPPKEAIKRLGPKDNLIKPSFLNPKITDEFENIIIKAMALFKEDRYQSVVDMRKDLLKIKNSGHSKENLKKEEIEAAEFRKTGEKFRLMAENAGDVIATLDNEGKVTYITRKVEKLIGLPPEKVIGKHFMHFFPPESAVKAIKHFKRPLESDQAIELRPLKLEAFNQKKEKIHVEISTSRIFEGDKIVNRICVIRDVTDRVKKEQRLAKKLEEFIRFNEETVISSCPGGIKNQISSFLDDIKEICGNLKL